MPLLRLNSPDEGAILAVIGKILGQRTFDELRTKQQLGCQLRRASLVEHKRAIENGAANRSVLNMVDSAATHYAKIMYRGCARHELRKEAGRLVAEALKILLRIEPPEPF